MDGILLVDKPKGWTSHDMVAKVRSELRKQGIAKPKVGHAGTLDPLATGLLIVLVGSYTKKANEYSKLDKVYEVEMKLGETSETGDEEGEKTKVIDKKPTLSQIQAILSAFTGEMSQTPHSFSAVKVGGQRAYKLARAGKDVKIEPRKVKIYEITDMKYDYPILQFTTKVSSGTYIRSLVEDIGNELGTGAYMTDLKRTQIGEYKLSQAISELNISSIEQNTLPK